MLWIEAQLVNNDIERPQACSQGKAADARAYCKTVGAVPCFGDLVVVPLTTYANRAAGPELPIQLFSAPVLTWAKHEEETGELCKRPPAAEKVAPWQARRRVGERRKAVPETR